MRKRFQKVVKPIAALLAVGFIYILIHLFTGFSIPCPLYHFTGLYCPGCGVSRMFFNLYRLDFAAAFASNPVLFCLFPVLFGYIFWRLYRYVRFGDRKNRKWEDYVCYGLIAVLLVFAVIRNIFPVGILVPQ